MDSSAVSSQGSGQRAVVIGAGMAGLVAARVLADHFDRVTVVDQDRLPTEATPRNGVPQGHHIHVLLDSGRNILNRLFPDLDDALTAAGAPRLDGAHDLAWLTSAGWAIRYPSEHVGHSASRPLLEWAVRQQVQKNPRIAFVEERSATGLLANDNRDQIKGVRIRNRQDTRGVDETLLADLVVDASGRGSHATRWLSDLGYPEPTRSEVNAFLGYSTRLYRLPPDPDRPWKGIYIQAKLPRDLRSGVLFQVEQDRWYTTLGGYGKDYPPSDDNGFLAYAKSLRTSLLYDAIKDAEPLTPIVSTRSSNNTWRHFEKLAHWPDGFVALGDAVCAFNPVYGQGMSVAAKEAVVLDDYLRDQRRRRPNGDLTGLARRFQQTIPKTIQSVWTIATGEDVRVPGAEGGQPGRTERFLHWYVDRVTQLTTEDVFARQILLDVLNLERPSTLLFHPRLVAKVLLGPTGRGNDGPNSFAGGIGNER